MLSKWLQVTGWNVFKSSIPNPSVPIKHLTCRVKPGWATKKSQTHDHSAALKTWSFIPKQPKIIFKTNGRKYGTIPEASLVSQGLNESDIDNISNKNSFSELKNTINWSKDEKAEDEKISGKQDGEKRKGPLSDEEFKEELQRIQTLLNEQLSAKGSEGSDKGGQNRNPIGRLFFVIFAASTAIALLALVLTRNRNIAPTPVEDLETLLKSGTIIKIVVDPESHQALLYRSNAFGPIRVTVGDVDFFIDKVESIQTQSGVNRDNMVPLLVAEHSARWSAFGSSFVGWVFTLIFLSVTYVLISSPGLRSGIKSKFQLPTKMSKKAITAVTSSTKFDQVAGLGEAKVEVMEFVSFLKNPQKYTILGARTPRGALLAGPPGTGKTLLAKATAGEAGVPFFSVTGSDFVEVYGGVGAARMRHLFSEARRQAPCIVFIDEIDAIGKKRSEGRFSNDERESTLNALLVEMDGFPSKSSVIVLAGTNRADTLDPALRRPGRFDRTITIDPPTKQERIEIFKVHLSPIKLQPGIDMTELLERLSAMTPGFVGADIANVCNEAAIIAAREEKEFVDIPEFEKALDRQIGGIERKTKVLTTEERKRVAYHEAGHAVAGWLLKHTSTLLKVTIIPRGKDALGYAQYAEQDAYLHSQDQLLDDMALSLGGRIAEMIFFNNSSSGAHDDLRKVTNMAHKIVTELGMSPKLGNISFPTQNDEMFSHRLYSSETASIIDSEVSRIINDVYKRTLELLTQNKEKMQLLAEKLLEAETLTTKDVVALIGPRPHGMTGVKPEDYTPDASKASL